MRMRKTEQVIYRPGPFGRFVKWLYNAVVVATLAPCFVFLLIGISTVPVPVDGETFLWWSMIFFGLFMVSWPFLFLAKWIWRGEKVVITNATQS